MTAKYVNVKVWKRRMHRNCQYPNCGKTAEVSCVRISLKVKFFYCIDHAQLGGIIEREEQ